jgi:hypothetical protein
MKFPSHILVIVVALCLALSGCANQQAVTIYPAAVASDAAARTVSALYTAGSINVSTAKKLSTDLHVADAVLKSMLNSAQSGQPLLVADAQALLTALTAISTDMQGNGFPQLPAARLAQLKSSQAKPKRDISISDIIMIINLAEALYVDISPAINNALVNQSPTLADAAAMVKTFETNLATLDAAIKPTTTIAAN